MSGTLKEIHSDNESWSRNDRKSFRNSTESKYYADEIHNGEYDLLVINAFRCNHFDLRQLTSGITHSQYNSIFHKLAKFIGLPADDDAIAFMLYRLLIYNRRGIRDKIDECECCRGTGHYFAEILNSGDRPTAISIPIKKIAINYEKVENVKLPPPFIEQINKLSPLTRSSSKVTYLSPTPSAESDEQILIKPVPPVLKSPSPNSEQSTAELFVYFQPELTIEQEDLARSGQGIDITCPRCGTCGKTNIQYKLGCMAYASTLAFMSFCLIPCAIVTLAHKNCRDVKHICRNCNYILGIVTKKPCKNATKWNWNKDTAVLPGKIKTSIIRDQIIEEIVERKISITAIPIS